MHPVNDYYQVSTVFPNLIPFTGLQLVTTLNNNEANSILHQQWLNGPGISPSSAPPHSIQHDFPLPLHHSCLQCIHNLLHSTENPHSMDFRINRLPLLLFTFLLNWKVTVPIKISCLSKQFPSNFWVETFEHFTYLLLYYIYMCI